jgi:3-oxoacyl-[acyl-carrier protein] reductase
VTGASRGIGKQIALAFGRSGARTAVHYHREEKKAREAAAGIREAGGESILLKANVGDFVEARRLVENVLKKWGRLDVLINNAGMSRDKVILKMTERDWREVIDTNLTGTFWCLKAAAAAMVRQKSGCIINIGSLIGLRGGVGCANYAASKGGLLALTRSAARELGGFGVRVNAVLPGFHPTDMGLTVWEKNPQKILGESVLGRLTDVFELSEFVVRLAGTRSVSGQVFHFDSRVV